MTRRIYIHRDEALDQTGYMPHRFHGESDKAYERRKGQASIDLQTDHGVTAYQVPGKRAFRFDQAEIDVVAAKITPIERIKRA